MPRFVLIAIALLFACPDAGAGSADARAPCEGGVNVGAADASVADAGCPDDPRLQPPDEQDPGGCDCHWGGPLPGLVPVFSLGVLVALRSRRHLRR